MKKIIISLISLFSIITLNSCSLAAYAIEPTQQYEDIYYTYKVDYQTILVKGTPVYDEDGNLAYYTYRNIYYYPYFYNNCWYVHPYHTIQPRGFVHRPLPGFTPEPRFKRPNNFKHEFRPNIYIPGFTPNINIQRTHTPNIPNRPNVPNKPNNNMDMRSRSNQNSSSRPQFNRPIQNHNSRINNNNHTFNRHNRR